LTSTSCSRIASEVLEQAIAGQAPGELPRDLVEEPCGKALFGILVEGLADRFEPALCETYVHLFSQAVAAVCDGVDAAKLAAHYARVRTVRRAEGRPKRVFVLSRVTLGADVAVTSVMLAAAKERFPDAEIFFTGPRKNYELFAADPRIQHAPVEYRRGSLRERLAAWGELRALLDVPDAVVIDPDSRLTQLGVLPVCAEDRHYFFESRAYGGDGSENLPELAARWAGETFGVPGAKPYIAPARGSSRSMGIAVSLGVGENPAKRIPDPFEEQLLSLLAGTGQPLTIDRGAGGEEADRVARAVNRAGVNAQFWDGSFAGFAEIIAAGSLYVGYDSAGQHVAAACGVPLVTIFAGFPVPRMFDRWRPCGPNCEVIRVDRPDADEILARVRRAVKL
jgi:ADP-heptose:LPS heptosyltransferase